MRDAGASVAPVLPLPHRHLRMRTLGSKQIERELAGARSITRPTRSRARPRCSARSTKRLRCAAE
jgi:hypothetical protein